ncbi:MAG TPA: MFS transporter, partial [Planctomycetaceae bacterium]|nr:MFS transporter [Planctomycetaceae bacterium]
EEFWIYPAVAAFVIMVVFLFLFKDDPKRAVTEEDVAKAAGTEELV